MQHGQTDPAQLEKTQDAVAFEICWKGVLTSRDQAQVGAIDLVYVGGPGFALARPNRRGWIRCGEQHCSDALYCQHLNVMAAWIRSTAEVLQRSVPQAVKKASEPLMILLGKASICPTAAIHPPHDLLKKSGATLKFLPTPYSSEPNRIEVMWRLMKHRWLALWRRSKEASEQHVHHVVAKFGGKLKMNFSCGPPSRHP